MQARLAVDGRGRTRLALEFEDCPAVRQDLEQVVALRLTAADDDRLNEGDRRNVGHVLVDSDDNPSLETLIAYPSSRRLDRTSQYAADDVGPEVRRHYPSGAAQFPGAVGKTGHCQAVKPHLIWSPATWFEGTTVDDPRRAYAQVH